MQYLAKWRPHPDVMWCWLIYRPVRSCMLSLRHMFLAPVLFSSVTLPLGGSWCCLVTLFQLWLGVPGALVSWDWWVSDHTWLGVHRVTMWDGNCRAPGKCCCCRFALRRPSHLSATTSCSGPFHIHFSQSVPQVKRGDTEKIWKRCFSS